MTTAYHNNPEEKKRAVKRAIHHKEAAMLISGTYGEFDGKFKGCSVGCDAYDITGAVQISPHLITAKYFGFPEWVERLRDRIYEGLPQAKKDGWHVSLKNATPVGFDEKGYEMVKAKFLIFVLNSILELLSDSLYEEKNDVIKLANESKAVWANYLKTGVLDRVAAATSAAAAYATSAAAAYDTSAAAASDAAYATSAAAAYDTSAASDAAYATSVAAAYAADAAYATSAAAAYAAAYDTAADAAYATAAAAAYATAAAYAADAAYADDAAAKAYEKYADHFIQLLTNA